MWIRAKVIQENGVPAPKGLERVFNLDQAKSWQGFDKYVELDMGKVKYLIDIPDKRMEILTGSSGHYASDY